MNLYKTAKNEAGNTYGLLEVLRPYGHSKTGTVWLCRCACGQELAVRGSALRSGNTRSCGCLKEMPFAERRALGLSPHGRERSARQDAAH